MRDDRNDASNGRPIPLGPGAPVTNGAGPHGLFGARARTVEADDPIDFVAVQADDELVNALGSRTGPPGGRGPELPGSPRGDGPDDRLVAMLAAWRAEIDAEPIPELVDLDTAVAAVISGAEAQAAATRRRRAGRARHLAPLAAAAAIIVATFTGVGLGSQNAMPGDRLWVVQKVVNPERAESVEAKVAVEGRLQKVRAALVQGDTVTAARELEAVRTEIPAVRGEEGRPLLLQEEEFLAAKLADTPPGTPADLTTPPTSNPTARSTTVPSAPAAPEAPSADPSLPAGSGEPAVPGSGDPNPGGGDEDLASVVEEPTAPQGGGPAAPGPSAPGPSAPGSSAPGPSAPQVTAAPDVPPPNPGPGSPAPEPGGAEGGADPTTAPGPVAEQPAQGGDEGVVSSPAAGGEPAAGTTTAGTTTASGSVGTDIEATGTATT